MAKARIGPLLLGTGPLAFGRLVFAVAIAVIVALDIWTLVLVLSSHGLGGPVFRNAYAAAVLLGGGHNPYASQAILHELERIAPNSGFSANFPLFPYLPWYPIVLWPLTLVPFQSAYEIWVLAAVVMVAWSARAWLRWCGFRGRQWMILVPLLVAAPVEEVVHYGETSALVLAGMTVSFALFQRRNWMAVGAVAVLVAALKPQDAVWLPTGYLLLVLVSDRKSWGKYTRGLLLGLGAVVLLPLAVNIHLWLSWWENFHRFAAAIGDSQLDVAGVVGIERWLPHGGIGTVSLHDPTVWAVGGLGGVALVAWVWRALTTPGWVHADPVDRWIALVAVPATLIMAFGPYFHTYDLLAWVPLLLWGLVRQPRSLKWMITWLILAGLEVTRVIQYIIPFPDRTLGSTTPLFVSGMVVLVGAWLGMAEGRLGAIPLADTDIPTEPELTTLRATN
ncbi:MAG: glycosyltransferase 87 family protein [Candidatus Dormibacteria bacterium]